MHARAIAGRLGTAGTVVLNDADPGNVARAGTAVAGLGARIITFQGNFADAPRRLAEAGLGHPRSYSSEYSSSLSSASGRQRRMRLGISCTASHRSWICWPGIWSVGIQFRVVQAAT